MKLKKYEDESKKRKIILISISVIVLISVSFLLYKTFANFSEEVEFPMMKGKVDYFGNSDIYFAFYQDDKKLEKMPLKDNKENLIFEHGECDNGASIEWDNEKWAPLINNLTISKTKCSLYFKEQIYIELGGMKVPVVYNEDGLYEVKHSVSEISNEWNKTEYRYAGLDPNNYVKFNNELWRIIGLVNVKTASGIEQRIKIVRQDGIEGQKDFGNYAWDRAENYNNNWTTSKLKDMLNGIYYESGTGECYTGSSNAPSVQNNCDFSLGTNIPKGLDETARNMIDKEVIWNIGGWFNEPTSDQFYEKERGTSTGSNNAFPKEWSKETDVGEKHNGIGIIYASDYGYAVGGNNRNKCLTKNLRNYNDEDNCSNSDWLSPNSGYVWTMSILSDTSDHSYHVGWYSYVFVGSVHLARRVWPVVYLSPFAKIIDGNGEKGTPFIATLN